MLNSLIGLNLNRWEEIVGGAIQLSVGKAIRLPPKKLPDTQGRRAWSMLPAEAE